MTHLLALSLSFMLIGSPEEHAEPFESAAASDDDEDTPGVDPGAVEVSSTEAPPAAVEQPAVSTAPEPVESEPSELRVDASETSAGTGWPSRRARSTTGPWIPQRWPVEQPCTLDHERKTCLTIQGEVFAG